MATIKTFGARVPQIFETGIIANLAAGAVIGFLARLAMTALTLAGGTSTNFALHRFTVPGTLRIMTFPMLFGIPLAFFLVWVWPRLPGSGWGKAFWAGVIIFVFPGLLSLADSSFKLNDSNLYVGIPLFSFLNFGYGFLLGLAIQFLNERATAINSVNRWARWGILAVMLAALVFLFIWSDVIAFNR